MKSSWPTELKEKTLKLELEAKAEGDSSFLRQELVGLRFQLGNERASFSTEMGEARGMIASLQEEMSEMPQAMKEQDAEKELNRLMVANEEAQAQQRAKPSLFTSENVSAAGREPMLPCFLD